MKSKKKKNKKINSKKQNIKKNYIKPEIEKVKAPAPDPAEKPPQFPFLLRRIVEMLVSSIICSLPIAILYAIGILPKTDYIALRIMGLSLFAYVIMSGYLLRAFFYSMGNRNIYFNVNILGYIIFTAINIIILMIFGDNTLPSFYAYIFMPYKFATVIMKTIGLDTAQMSTHILAPIVTHILMLFVIIISPFEMYTFERKKK